MQKGRTIANHDEGRESQNGCGIEVGFGHLRRANVRKYSFSNESVGRSNRIPVWVIDGSCSCFMGKTSMINRKILLSTIVIDRLLLPVGLSAGVIRGVALRDPPKAC